MMHSEECAAGNGIGRRLHWTRAIHLQLRAVRVAVAVAVDWRMTWNQKHDIAAERDTGDMQYCLHC